MLQPVLAIAFLFTGCATAAVAPVQPDSATGESAAPETVTTGPGGMEIQRNRPDGMRTERVRCRNRAAEPRRETAPTVEAGINQPMGASSAGGPNIYTRYQDCPE